MKHGALLEFASGMAVIMAPAPINAYVALAVAGARGARHALAARRHRSRSSAGGVAAAAAETAAETAADAAASPDAAGSAAKVPPVTLEFDVSALLLPDKKAQKAARKQTQNAPAADGGGDEAALAAAAAAAAASAADAASAAASAALPRVVLDGVAGSAKPGRLLAIMGPSGSGKTTLLNALAGQVPARSRVRVEGYVGLNGAPLQPGGGRHAAASAAAADGASSPPRSAYVQQDDNFFSMLTALETLETHAALLLPGSVPEAERAARVARLLGALGLARVQDSRVGGQRARGLSGGERKRLAIGCELVASPSLLFLDEPTTGLDAFQAGRVVDALRALARERGLTVVAVVHQPRSSIFAAFDDLLLVAEGRALYFGPAEGAVAWFAGRGLICPQNYNPAEFLADLASVDTSSPQAEAESRARVAALADAWAAGGGARAAKRAALRAGGPAAGGGDGARATPASSTDDDEGDDDAVKAADDEAAALVPGAAAGAAAAAAAALAGAAAGPPPAQGGGGGGGGSGPGLRRQLALLFTRSARQIARDRSAASARLASNLSSALMFGAIFFRMGRSQASVKDRLGLLQVSAINAAMSSLVKTLNVFPRERLLVQRERARGAYGALPYLIAKLAAELPVSALYPLAFGAVVYPLAGLRATPRAFASFLGVLTLESFSASALGLAVGAFAPSTEAAVAVGPALMLVHILFGGAYISAESVPGPLKALPGQSLIRQSYEALVVNEFRGLGGGGKDKGEAFFEAPEGGAGGGGATAAVVRNGDDALEFFGFGATTVRGACARQARILATYWWLTFCLLKAGRPRFAPLHRPPAAARAALEAAEAEAGEELRTAEDSMAAIVG